MSLWRHRDFRLLWAGQSVSELGSQVSVLAIPLLAIDRLHASPFAVGVLTAMQTLPFVLVGLPAGAWVDRVRRRAVLIGADAGRAVLLASIPVASLLSVLSLVQLAVVTLAAGILSVFFDVAYQSYLPSLVGRDRLIEGNGKLAATTAGAQVGGPAAGGALVGAVGAAGAVLADAASYAVSFASLLAIRAPEPRPPTQGAERSTLRAEIAEGLRFVWREPRIRSVALATATSNLFSAMGLAVVLVFLRREIHLSAAHIGVLLAAGAVGGVAGAAGAGRLGNRFGIGRVILATIVVAGAGQAAYPFVTPANADVLVVAGGILYSGGAVAYNINQVSLRQALCPPPLLGRMNATVRFMVWGTMPLGALVGGALASAVGLRATLGVVAIGSACAFGWIAFSPVPSVRTIPTGEWSAASWHSDPVALAVGAHVGPWSEKDLVGLPDDAQRYELLEGALVVSPPPGGAHQRISLKLGAVLDAVTPDDLVVVEAMGVRLPDDTVFIADLVVATRHVVLADHSGVLDAVIVALVVEIVSPGSQTTDRVTKPAVYARAGIASFWRVEPEQGPTIVAYRREQGRYVEVASARPGERLVVNEPFPISIDPDDLRP